MSKQNVFNGIRSCNWFSLITTFLVTTTRRREKHEVDYYRGHSHSKVDWVNARQSCDIFQSITDDKTYARGGICYA